MKNLVYGYARVSTVKQSIARQIDNIRQAYPEAVIIDETFTGTTTDRPAFNKLMKQIEKEAEKGNQVTLVFDEVSRMSRNAEEGFALYEKLFGLGIDLRFIKEPFLNSDTIKTALQNRISLSVETGNSASDALMNTIIEALNRFALDMVKENIKKAFEMAQTEIEYLHKRTSEGVRKAQAAGKQVGRAVGAEVVTKKEVAAKEAIMKYSKDFRGTLADAEVIKLAGCSRNSYYKYKSQMKNYKEEMLRDELEYKLAGQFETNKEKEVLRRYEFYMKHIEGTDKDSKAVRTRLMKKAEREVSKEMQAEIKKLADEEIKARRSQVQ